MDRHPNVQLGDIVLVRYAAKYGRDGFGLARIVDLHPDRHGVVRTVTVWLRNRRQAGREPAETCGRGVVKLVTPVQRLVTILPAEDQPQELIDGLRVGPVVEEGRGDGGQEVEARAPELEVEPEVGMGSPNLGSQGEVPEVSPERNEDPLDEDLVAGQDEHQRGAQRPLRVQVPASPPLIVDDVAPPPLPQRARPRRGVPPRDPLQRLSPVRPGGRVIRRR